jgi:hypothetical protein
MDRRDFVRRSASSLLGTGLLIASGCDIESSPSALRAHDAVAVDDLASSWGSSWSSLRYNTKLESFDGAGGFEMNPATRDAMDGDYYMGYPVIVTSDLAHDVSVRCEVRPDEYAAAGVIARSSFDACYALMVASQELILCRYTPAERITLDQARLSHQEWWSLSLVARGNRLLGIARSGDERVRVETTDGSPLPAGYFGLLGLPVVASESARVRFRRFRAKAFDRVDVFEPPFAYAYTGAIMPTGSGFAANVTARTVVPKALVFEIAEDESFEGARRTRPIAPSGGLKAVHGRLEGLAGGQTYFWRPVATHDRTEFAGPARRFRTPPSRGEAVRFVFASCTAGGQSNYPSFLTARNLDPDLYLHAGDWGYVDGFALDKSADHFHAWWIRMLGAPGIAELLETTPLLFWQDDHDYDADFGWRETVNPIAVAAFDELNANPSKEFFDVRWGDVHVWCLDCRKYATDPAAPDGPAKSRLGETQKHWLKQGMRDSDAPVRVVASAMVFRNKKEAESGWHNVYAHERDELLEYFAEIDATVVILSGDAHGHRLIHHFEFGELYEINSSGTDFGGNGESGNYDPEHTLINYGEANAFAFVSLDPESQGRRLVVRVVEREHGDTLFEKSFAVS